MEVQKDHIGHIGIRGGENDLPVWCTLNDLTTKDKKLEAYKSTSATKKYLESDNTVALIRTIGWGADNNGVGVTPSVNNITPGELFLGKMNGIIPEYGYLFTQRPSGVKFDYKYEPKDNDTFVVEVIVENMGKWSFETNWENIVYFG